jgi:hypothetical protein
MKVHATMLVVTAAAALAAFKPAPAQAEVWYPWCAQYSGGEKGIGATVCSFVSREQCLASVRGLGGFCSENPAPPPPVRQPVRR